MLPDGRLLKIAGMVRQGDRVADIGTDHAHLPIFLVKNGISKKVFACDVAEGPINNARANLVRSGVDGVLLRIGDGLCAVSPDEIDTAVIAGMGGDLIIKILEAAPWIKYPRYELLLQPMTSVEELRRYLCENGFSVSAERAVRSMGRTYTVMKAVFNGKPMVCTPIFYYFGRLCENPGADEMVYINRKRRILSELSDSISGIPGKEDETAFLAEVLSGIGKLID